VSSYIEDFPATDPRFDFGLIAESLLPLLEQPAKGALVLGIHGPWGSGKTTLLEAIRDVLEPDDPSPGAGPVIVDFNAWKFQQREALSRALILRLIAELRKSADKEAASDLDELEQSLYRAFVVQEKGPWKVNWQSLITEVITIGLAVIHLDFVGKALSRSVSWIAKLFPRKKGGDGLDEKSIEQLGSILERATTQRQVDQVQSIEQFLGKFKQVVEKIQLPGRRVYVLIDDLDRCLPEDALDIFESIKLFLDAPGCVFLVALDRDVIRKGLSLRYEKGGQVNSSLLIDPDEYIEKTISISYDLPALSDEDARSIIDEFTLPVTLDESHKNLLVGGLGTNPRRVKRFMNTLSFQLNLAALASGRGRHVPPGLLGDHQGDRHEFSRYLKLLILSYRYSGVFALAFKDDDIFIRLQSTANFARTDRDARYQRLRREVRAVQALESDEAFWALIGSNPQFTHDNAADLLRWFRGTSGAGLSS
jgi:hypothetical protein